MFQPTRCSQIIGVAITLTCSCLMAESFGYWLHRLLHSDKVPFLSRGHLTTTSSSTARASLSVTTITITQPIIVSLFVTSALNGSFLQACCSASAG